MEPISTTHEVLLPDGTAAKLSYTHRAFATAQHRLKQQGIDVALLGPSAEAFWRDIGREVEVSGNSGELQKLPDFDPYKVGILLYVGLLKERPALTLEAAQDLITFENAAAITATVMAAVTEALMPLAQRMEAASQPDDRPLAPVSGGASDGQ
jgi:hypothetical protein